MSSLQRLNSLYAQRAEASALRVQRVRHGVRDQILVMVFSASVSLAVGFLLSLLVAHAVGVAKP